MASIDISDYIQRHKTLVDDALDARLPRATVEPRRIHEAMRYATLSGGKRLRPIFALAMAGLAERDPDDVLDTACAVELIHTASLILDDLPCMDDAQDRRGRPCTHLAFDKATALLATMGLLAQAFHLVARNAARVNPGAAAEAVSMLAGVVGTNGLVYGQHLDLALTGCPAGAEELLPIHGLKAGALFLASVQIPARLLDMDGAQTAAVSDYARALGLAFQIIDDLHDAGHPREDAGKTTYAQHLGFDGASERARNLLAEAEAALAPLGEGAAPLRLMAEYLRGPVAG